MGSQKLQVKEYASCVLNKLRPVKDMVPLLGKYTFEHYRQGKLLERFEVKNDITTAAKNSLFDTFFNGASQVTSSDFCGGLINNAGFTGYNVADTMSSHSGWVEWTNYSQSTRVTWGQGAASSAAITNASPMQFDINATGVIRGLFITTVNTKGGTTGLLWSAASFTNTVSVVSGDQIRSTYSLSC